MIIKCEDEPCPSCGLMVPEDWDAFDKLSKEEKSTYCTWSNVTYCHETEARKLGKFWNRETQQMEDMKP